MELLMSYTAAQLRPLIAALLRSRPVQAIRFRIDGSTIMSFGYGYIADMIEQQRVQIGFGNTGGFTANFDHVKGSPAEMNFDPNLAWNDDAMATVVHETTHAVVDAVRVGRPISYGDNEVAAYVAETLFKMNKGITFNTVGPVAGPLYSLTSAVQARAKSDSCFDIDQKNGQTLRTAILNVYTRLAALQGKSVPATVMPLGIP
jgi:hypothetical protein